MFLTWFLAATSGTIPPYLECILICDETTLLKILKRPRSTLTIAAEVSSHDVSIPSIIIIILYHNGARSGEKNPDLK
jgi:hypothetical protein